MSLTGREEEEGEEGVGRGEGEERVGGEEDEDESRSAVEIGELDSVQLARRGRRVVEGSLIVARERGEREGRGRSVVVAR